MSVVEDFGNALFPPERVVFDSVLAIDDALIAEEASAFLSAGHLVLTVVSRADRSCPFEIAIGRGSQVGRIAFYIGSGVEMVDWEDITVSDTAAWVAVEIDDFLRSAVTCARTCDAAGPVVDDYLVSRYAARYKGPFRYRHRRAWPWAATAASTIHYAPWIEGPQREGG